MTARAPTKVAISGRRNGSGTYIDFAFASGETRTFLLSPDHPLYDEFAAHGVGKKVRDQIAGIKTEKEAIEMLDKLLKAFNEGKWNTQRNGDGSPQVGLLAQALARKYGRTLEQAQEFVSKLSKKQQADLRAEPGIAQAIAELRATAAPDKSVADLLGGFALRDASLSADPQ